MGQIWGDSTMGSISSSSSLLGLIQLNVGDNQLLQIERLELGIVLQVLNEGQEILDRLLWPSSLSPSELSSLSSSSDSSVESHERNALFVLEDLSEVASDLLNGLAFHHLGSLVGVLEVAWDLVSTGLGVFLGLGLNRVIGHRL